MFFSIEQLEIKKIVFNEIFGPEDLEFPNAVLTLAKPLLAEGVAELFPDTGGQVRIQGRMSSELIAECDRCLKSFQFPIDAPIDLFYRPATDLEGAEGEIEIDEGEAQIAFYEGKGIELKQVVAEQVLLMLPMQLICRHDCKGICGVCGANRNEESCDCRVAPTNDQWGELKNLVN